MKTRLTLLVALATTIMLTGASAWAADRLAYGSTATRSAHYTYTVAAGKAINTHSGGNLDVTVISTGGAVDNLGRLARGQIHMGIGTFATVYQAYKGLGKFEDKAMPKLRSLWVHGAAFQAWVVREDSGVKDLAGLAGKKFTAGQRGSATEQLVNQILDTIGVKPDYYVATLSDAVAAVKDGRSIGYVKAGRGKSLDGTTLELKAFVPIRVLGFSPDQAATVQGKFPFITFASFKKNEIQGVDAFTAPVQVVGTFALADSVTDAQAEAIIKGIIEGHDIQAAAFPSVKDFDIAERSLALLNVPLHAGAVRYYRSMGLAVPDHLVPPEMK